jgi:hypothetical protein
LRTLVVVVMFVAGCWHGDVPVIQPPPAAGPPSEHLGTTPIDPVSDALEDMQRLDIVEPPWREVSVMHRTGEYDLVLTTDAGKFAAVLDSQLDGLIVDDLSLHVLVPNRRPWVVVIYDAVHDGGKVKQLVACQAGPGNNPECTQPFIIEANDLRDEPSWRVDYIKGGGIVIVPRGGGPPRRFSF